MVENGMMCKGKGEVQRREDKEGGGGKGERGGGGVVKCRK